MYFYDMLASIFYYCHLNNTIFIHDWKPYYEKTPQRKYFYQWHHKYDSCSQLNNLQYLFWGVGGAKSFNSRDFCMFGLNRIYTLWYDNSITMMSLNILYNVQCNYSDQSSYANDRLQYPTLIIAREVVYSLFPNKKDNSQSQQQLLVQVYSKLR